MADGFELFTQMVMFLPATSGACTKGSTAVACEGIRDRVVVADNYDINTTVCVLSQQQIVINFDLQNRKLFRCCAGSVVLFACSLLLVFSVVRVCTWYTIIGLYTDTTVLPMIFLPSI